MKKYIFPLVAILLFGYSKESKKNPVLISITTKPVNEITSTTAMCGGTITSDGGYEITEVGVCYNTDINPDTSHYKAIKKGIIRDFRIQMYNLTAGTRYYVRAYGIYNYADSLAITIYGNEISFITTVGSGQTKVRIGLQTWMQKNLDVSTYRDGTPIPQVTDPTIWKNLKTGAWCYYNNDPALGTIYCKLYNWYAVAGIWNNASKADSTKRKKLAPAGYHIPTDVDWTKLTRRFHKLETEAIKVAGDEMKETGTTHWNAPNTGSNNRSGFTGLPGGYRNLNGVFVLIGNFGYWWSSTEHRYDTASALYRSLSNGYGSIERSVADKKFGFSVRCISD